MTDNNRHGLISRALVANRREVQDLEEKLEQLHSVAEELRQKLVHRLSEAEGLREQLAAAPRRPPAVGPDIGAQHQAYLNRRDS